MPIDPAIGGAIKLSASQSAKPDMAQPDDRVFDSLLAGALNKQGSGVQASPASGSEAGVVKDSSDSDHRTLESSNPVLQSLLGTSNMLGPKLSDSSIINHSVTGETPVLLFDDITHRVGQPSRLSWVCIINRSIISPLNKEGGGGITITTSVSDTQSHTPNSELQTPYVITTSASETQSPLPPFNKGGQGGILEADLIKSEVATGFSLRNELSASSESVRGGQIPNKEQNKGLSLTEVSMKPENIFSHVDNRNNADGSTWAQRVTEPSEVIHIRENTFVITKKDSTAIEISLEPDGIGKLDIEISLDRGVINAQINASETIGKELIERNLYNILNALIKDGLNIGGFSVSLRDKRNEMKDDVRERDLRGNELTKKIQLPIAYSSKGIISIFV